MARKRPKALETMCSTHHHHYLIGCVAVYLVLQQLVSIKTQTTRTNINVKSLQERGLIGTASATTYIT
jgi:hypothetical protein